MTGSEAPVPTKSIAREVRAGELDALGAVLPAGSADRLAGLLTDTDVATLRHVAERGMGANTLRALASDLGYLEAWAQAATGGPLPWPAPLDLALKYVAHHLWDREEQNRDPDHGMPETARAELVAVGVLRKAGGPHAPATVRRRLASWATLTAWRGLEGPFADPALKKALRLAVRGQDRGRRRHSREAVTKPVMAALLAPLDAVADSPLPHHRLRQTDILRARRDRAMLSLAFAAGGRRRSEIAGLHMDRLSWRPLEDAPDQSVVRIALGRTKTTDAGDGATVTVAGRTGADLAAWIETAGITDGPVFRRLDRWGNVGAAAISPQSVNLILKQRLAEAGFEPADYSAHGLRAGFLTEAAHQGLALSEAMAQSGHRSATQAAAYYNAAEAETGRAARLLE